MTKSTVYALVSMAALAVAGQANAAPTTYIGADDNVGSLAQMTNSVAASALFNAAVPGATLVDFEGSLPSALTISGGSITSNSGCGTLCGFNTTSGGANFLSLFGGTATFNFSSPVNSFGFYINGLQTSRVGQQTVTFSDGSSQLINFPSAVEGGNGGGGAFIGFTDFGKNISSVSVFVSNDIIAIDDLRFGFGSGGVPEPAAWALMISGFGLVGGALRRRRETVRVTYA